MYLLKGLVYSFLVSIAFFIVSYWIYCLSHFGFGEITVPDWYEFKSGSLEPFPVQEVVSYWAVEGLKLSGIISFVIFANVFVIVYLRDFKNRKRLREN